MACGFRVDGYRGGCVVAWCLFGLRSCCRGERKLPSISISRIQSKSDAKRDEMLHETYNPKRMPHVE